MTLRETSDTSVVISLFRYLFISRSLVWQKINYVYRHSQTCKLAEKFRAGIKISFRYSFLGRITETGPISSGLLDNSKLVQYLLHSYKKWMSKIIQLHQSSSTADLAKDTKKNLFSYPVRIISMIGIIAITVNVIFSFVFRKEICLWGWLMRGLFFSLAVLGVFCQANWQSVKKNSIFLKKL